jgi:ABC-2 type transport system permease protein
MNTSVSKVLLASIIRKRAEYARYWFDFTVGLAIKFIFFLGIVYAVPLEDPRQAAARLSGFTLWYLSSHVLSKLGNLAIEEAYLGTAEQVLTTRARPLYVVLGVVIAEVLFSAVWIALFLLLAVPLVGLGTLSEALGTMLGPLVVFSGIGLLGMLGIGALVLGLSLRFKQVGAVTEVILYYLLIFSGFFLPPDLLPSFFQLLNGLSPLAWTVQGMQQGFGLTGIALLVSLLWLSVGFVVLALNWRWARKAGRLGSYV